MNYKYTDLRQPIDSATFEDKYSARELENGQMQELYVGTTTSGVWMPQGDVVNLVEELQQWLEENPKKLVKTEVSLLSLSVGEDFEAYGVRWEKVLRRSTDPLSYCRCKCLVPVNNCTWQHLLWGDLEVQVMR